MSTKCIRFWLQNSSKKPNVLISSPRFDPGRAFGYTNRW